MAPEIEANAFALEDLPAGSLLFVKVGSDKFPASDKDMAEAKQLIADLIDDPGMKGKTIRALVTHHCFDISAMAPGTDEYESLKAIFAQR